MAGILIEAGATVVERTFMFRGGAGTMGVSRSGAQAALIFFEISGIATG